MQGVKAYTLDSDEFNRLKDIEERYAELTKLMDANDQVWISVTSIAKAYGMTRQDVANRPWMLPKFGIMDSPEKQGKGRKRFWRYEEYLDWVAIPEKERIAMYKKQR